MKRLFMLVMLLALLSYSSYSQDKKKDIPVNIGIYGGLNFNFHTPNFMYGVVDIVDPSIFYGNVKNNKNATSIGGNFGIIGNFPIDNMFVISGRIGYNMLGGDLKDTTGLNTTKSKINYLEISPILQIHDILDGKGLYLLAGMELGIPLTKTFSTDYVIPGQTPVQTRTDFIKDAEITNSKTRIALAVGAGWMFEVSDNVFLTPELSYRIPFSKVSSDSLYNTWDIPQLRLGVALTFGLVSENEKPVVTEPDAAQINVGMKKVNALDINAKSSKLSKIQVEEVQYTELFPLVPYVFFDENSSDPNPSTQKMVATREAGSFTIDALDPDAVKINSYTLDIIGARMQKDKNSKIQVVGTVDNINESAKSGLAKKRADFVKNYLVVNYEIDGSRISTEASDLPSKPSSNKDPEGVQENRRAEIYSESPNSGILAPIMISSDKQRLSTPPVVEFIPEITSADEIGGWDMEIRQSDRLLKKISGEGTPANIQWAISPNELADNEIPVDYNLTAWTKKGIKNNYSSTIPVEFLSISRKKSEDRPDKIISKYSLMLFDFNSPDVSGSDAKIIEKNIIPAIKYNSTVQVYGYTDRIGTEDYNKNLANQRATNVRNLLQSKMKDVKYEVFGVGEGVQIYDNNLTVGRQLSRTVQVYVITPKK
jgi:outer membrane protein OmpA-like peptidoglycan-associated protein